MSEISEAHRRCLRRGLTALASMFLRADGRFREFVEIAREAFIDAASRELEKKGLKVNPSRVSVLTGIDRISTRRVMSEGESRLPVETTASLSSRIIGQWEQDSRFTTQAGKPRILKHEGTDSQFSELVRSVDTCVTPGTVLVELERIGAIEKTPRGLRLKELEYTYSKGASEILEMLGENIETLVQAAEENSKGENKIRNLNSRTDFNQIYIKDIPSIRKWLLREGSLFHKKVRSYLAKRDADMTPIPGKEAGGVVAVVSCGVAITDSKS
ncbi:MAG: hypothetical protein KDD70_01125 [Bdellovibrionales bacterium]|nr:hypothetical protein [Bdellovibrionales bacterium]